VLLPVVVKARWPDRIGAMTGVYTTAQSLLAGLASALCVPLSRLAGFGWRGALAVWAVPAVVAAVLWIPLASFRAERPAAGGAAGGAAVWRSRVAWYCTLYMGSQAILYYSFSAWLPAILAARGVDGATAGFMASVYQLIGIVSNFVAPLTAGKLRDQRPLTGAVGVLYLAGALLMLFGRSAAALWPAVLLCGFSTGCCFSLCMALIGMRTKNAQDASRLSGMLQTVGYIIAALGPVAVGRLLDVSGGWTLPLAALLAGVAFCGVMGQLAGRPGVVE
jgi:CP family cyanate transporter-like MFS transporter